MQISKHSGVRVGVGINLQPDLSSNLTLIWCCEGGGEGVRVKMSSENGIVVLEC